MNEICMKLPEELVKVYWRKMREADLYSCNMMSRKKCVTENDLFLKRIILNLFLKLYRLCVKSLGCNSKIQKGEQNNVFLKISLNQRKTCLRCFREKYFMNLMMWKNKVNCKVRSINTTLLASGKVLFCNKSMNCVVQWHFALCLYILYIRDVTHLKRS